MDTLRFVKDGQLVGENEWFAQIDSLHTDFNDLEINKERAKRQLARAIIEATKKRATGKFGILFSGGVDSSLLAFIALKLGSNFTCYTVGIEGSDDIEWAKKVADEYKFNFRFRKLSLDELELNLKAVVKIVKNPDIVTVSVGSVFYSAAKLALSAGDNILFGGLGSEEIFAGYQRHEEALKKGNFEALHEECWNGLRNMLKRDLVRDYLIASDLGIDMRVPFMDIDVVRIAMNIHAMHKLDSQNKKIILRDAAEFIGLKKEFAWRKKQAAQYGSNFVNGIEKLAKRKGFKYKKDYLQSLLK